MKLDQKFAYEHGNTFQSDQRMHILIYEIEEVFNYIGFFCIEIPTEGDSKFVSTVEDDRVSGQHLVRSSYMDVRLLSKFIENHTNYYT